MGALAWPGAAHALEWSPGLTAVTGSAASATFDFGTWNVVCRATLSGTTGGRSARLEMRLNAPSLCTMNPGRTPISVSCFDYATRSPGVPVTLNALSSDGRGNGNTSLDFGLGLCQFGSGACPPSILGPQNPIARQPYDSVTTAFAVSTATVLVTECLRTSYGIRVTATFAMLPNTLAIL